MGVRFFILQDETHYMKIAIAGNADSNPNFGVTSECLRALR